MADFPIPSPLSHAYIVTGGSAQSRAAYAKKLAQAYVCTAADPPCGYCRNCRKAAEGVHPDVTTVSPAGGKRDILVDQARALRSDAYIKPNEAARKVYLIDGAEAMNPAAQNTLLKVLEDGPAYAAFLLVTGQAGGLLQTVRSRCETVVLPPEEEPSGSPEAARGAAELLTHLAGRNEMVLAEFCVTLEKWDREALSALLEEEISLLRHALAVRAGAACNLSPETRPAVKQAATVLTARQLSDLAELCRRLDDACGFNVSAGHLAGWLCAGAADILAGGDGTGVNKPRL